MKKKDNKCCVQICTVVLYRNVKYCHSSYSYYPICLSWVCHMKYIRYQIQRKHFAGPRRWQRVTGHTRKWQKEGEQKNRYTPLEKKISSAWHFWQPRRVGRSPLASFFSFFDRMRLKITILNYRWKMLRLAKMNSLPRQLRNPTARFTWYYVCLCVLLSF